MAVAVGDRDRQSSRSKVSRNTAELNNAGLLLSRWGDGVELLVHESHFRLD